MRIRKIQPADRSDLKNILRSQEHFRPEEIRVALELIDISLSQPGQEDYLLRCAEGTNGEIQGYVCYGKAPLTDAVYDIYWIVVHPSSWRQGTGSALLRIAEEDMLRLRARLVLVETSSSPSYEIPRAFYQKHGYREQARVPDYYSLGDHKIILGKTLNS